MTLPLLSGPGGVSGPLKLKISKLIQSSSKKIYKIKNSYIMHINLVLKKIKII